MLSVMLKSRCELACVPGYCPNSRINHLPFLQPNLHFSVRSVYSLCFLCPELILTILLEYINEMIFDHVCRSAFNVMPFHEMH